MSEPQQPALDTAFTLLAESRRRHLLYHFLENDWATVETLSRRLTAWEEDLTVREVDDDDRERVAVSLVHNHLPRLADHDVLEYDPRNGDVVTSSGFEGIRPVLERSCEIERDATVPERADLSTLYSEPPEGPSRPEK